jgi:hypothetical protein
MQTNWNYHMLLVGILNSAGTLKDSLAVPEKVEHKITR